MSTAPPGIDAALWDRLGQIARAPVLLVASDYDGTLAPITAEPARAVPRREAIVALRVLSQLRQTHVAVISGRGLEELARLAGTPESVHLIGSHGSEFDPGFARSLSPAQRALLDRLGAELSVIAARAPGLLVEHKPAAVAFHYRASEPAAGEAACREVLAGPAHLPGVSVRHGKMVVELAVLETSKGQALETVRARVGASAVLFVGDDATDEDAFSVLRGPDVGIKVGPGPTRAAYRVGDPVQVARVLARIAELREAWLFGAGAVPIERHALLSDQRTLALVTPGARLAWLCLPRLDSPALFAEMLGGESAGYFDVAPADGAAPLGQEYLGDSFVLRTRYPGLTITDYLDCSAGRPFQRAGRSELVRVLEGPGPAVIRFAPRLDFGRVATRLSLRPTGLWIEDTPDPTVLHAPGLRWELHAEGVHQTAIARADLAAGPVTLELRHGTGDLSDGVIAEPRRREQTLRFWEGWAASLRVPALEPALVRRSALVLKALVYGPTGAVAAAGTTSLPEHIGGVRNWDYRYCWPRDAAMAAAALVRLGSTGVGLKFLDWMLGILEDISAPERLRPIYTVSGRSLGPEAEIGELSGYRGSRPVRVGNAAANQVQLDVFGPIVELIALLAEAGAPLSPEHWRLAEAMVRAVAARWREPDHGIWEERKPRQHHVHSKVMCWLTVDRALRIAARHWGRQFPEWERLRDEIADDVLTRGFSPELGAFSATYEQPATDAAALWVILSGLLAPSDPRAAGTVAAVEAQLRVGPTVYRYLHDDGLPGMEGGFHICFGWLIECHLAMGRRDEALAMFRDLVGLVGPTGLLSEQYDPTTRVALGNHPQAYSHLALINAAIALSAPS